MLLIMVSAVYAQSEGDYQTRVGASGNWTATNIWQQYQSGAWTDVATYPSASDGAITILSGSTLIYDQAVPGGIDQLVINGFLTVPLGITFTTVDGPGVEVAVNGTLLHQGTVPVMAGTGVLNSGSTYIHNTSSSASNALNFFTTKANDSTWIYRGSNTLVPSVSLTSRSYGNLEFQSQAGTWPTNWTGTGILTVNGNFTLGSGVTINYSNTGINVMKGNYTINGAISFGAGTQNISFQGINKSIGGSGIVAFETASIAVGASYSLSAPVNVLSGFTFTVNGTLGCGGYTFNGAGGFTVSGGATFKICSPNGINGNVLVTGTKTYSTSANYEFYGAANQITGTGFPIQVNNLTINTDYTVTLSNTLVVSGTLHFTKGYLALGNYSLLGSGNVTGAPEIIYDGTGSAIAVGSNIDAIIRTQTPSILPATVNSLVVETGIGNNFLLPNDVSASSLVFTSGGIILNHNVLALSGKDIQFHAPNSTTYLSGISVLKTDSPALAGGGNQSISRLWNIGGLSSAPVEITLSWPTPAADAGIVFTDNKAMLWNFNGGNWVNMGIQDITTVLGVRSVSFSANLGAKDVNNDWTLSGDGQTLPVELSSFSASQTAQNFVQLNWVTQSELGMLGYRIYRSQVNSQAAAVSITPSLIPATNTSTTQSYNFTDREVASGQTYYYWLEAVDMSASYFHGPLSFSLQGETPPISPELSFLRNAYPNPFRRNESTRIEVSVKAGETGSLTIYNVLGQKVMSYNLREGLNPLNWNGRDINGNPVASGVYFYRLSTPSLNDTRKMVLMR